MVQLPDWSPLGAVAPPATDGGGRIVALVATETALARAWAPGAAVDLARSWSSAGGRVILVDAALQAPSLHDAAGVANREGLSDAALYGASIGRVSRSVDEGSFYVITAGTPVADVGSVVKSGRWHRVAEGMTEAGVLVLLYLRASDPETAAFLGSASDIVLLADPGDPAPPAIQDLLPLVRAVTGSSDGPSARVAAGVGAASGRPAVPVEVGEEAGASAGGSGSSTTSDSLATPLAGDGGMGKVILLLVAALLSSVGLGYVLTVVL